jgi:hypothetical protein
MEWFRVPAGEAFPMIEGNEGKDAKGGATNTKTSESLCEDFHETAAAAEDGKVIGWDVADGSLAIWKAKAIRRSDRKATRVRIPNGLPVARPVRAVSGSLPLSAVVFSSHEL